MKPRYTKRVREEAALICAIAASTPGLSCNYAEVRMLLGLPVYGSPGVRWGGTLESEAWRAICRTPAGARMTSLEIDMEAAQLIEDGWSPGDPL